MIFKLEILCSSGAAGTRATFAYSNVAYTFYTGADLGFVTAAKTIIDLLYRPPKYL